MIINAGMRIIPSKGSYSDFGSVGGLVYHEKARAILTCFHCVFDDTMKEWKHPELTDKNRIVKIFNEDRSRETTGEIIGVVRDERVDVAVIRPSKADEIEASISNWGAVTGIRIIEPNESDVWLRIFGAKSPESIGKYAGIKPEMGSFYSPEIEPHYLTSLIKVRPVKSQSFSAKGDSGSFVLDLNNNLIGAVVMGDDDYSYVMSASIIQARLKVKFK